MGDVCSMALKLKTNTTDSPTPIPAASNPDLLRPEQAGAFLGGITSATLANWRITGRYKLPFVKVGRLVRYRRQDLEEFLKSRVR